MKFSKANKKIRKLRKIPAIAPYLANGRKIYSFDMLAGWSCPWAKECQSRVIISNNTRKIQDGKDTIFRCYAASLEVLFPELYNLHKRNLTKMRRESNRKNRLQLSYYIEKHLPPDLGVCRLHSSGDFFNMVYMDAWALVAYRNPDKLFYAYTKAIVLWLSRITQLPPNLVLTASYGGTHDHLIEPNKLRSAVVVFSEQEAKDKGLEIDHDDSHAADPTKGSFALLIHGTQPKGSKAAKAKAKLERSVL